MALDKVFTQVATYVSRLTGRAGTFVACIALIVVWAASGPLFGFSDTWQLIVNTSTTIITFLMVFLIQNTQNRDNAALQAKLDELIRVSAGKDEMIGIEKLTDKELEEILREFDAKEIPVGEKSKFIARKAAQAQNRKEAKPGGKPARRKSSSPAKRG